MAVELEAMDTSAYEESFRTAMERSEGVAEAFFKKGIAGNKALEASFKATLPAADRIALKIRELYNNADEATRKSEGFVATLSRMANKANEAAEKLEKAGKRTTDWGNIAGGVGKLAAGAAVGIGVMTAALVSGIAAADDWNEDLRSVGLSIKSMSVDRAAASIDAIGASFKAAGVQIVSEFSPQIESASTRMVALGFAAVDSFKNLQQGEGVMEHLARFAADVLAEAFVLPLRGINRLGQAFASLGKLVGVDVSASFDIFNDTIDDIKADQSDALTASLKMLAKDGVAPLIAVTDDYMSKAGQLVTRQVAVNRATRDSTKEAQKAKEETEKRAQKEVEALQKTREAWISATVQGLNPLNRALADLETLQYSGQAAVRAGAITWDEYTVRVTQAGDAAATAYAKADPTGLKTVLEGVAKDGQEVSNLQARFAKATTKEIAETSVTAASTVTSALDGLFGQMGSNATATLTKTQGQIEDLEGKITKTTDAGEKRRLKVKLQALKAQEAANQEAVLKAFRLQQATGVVGVAISTAQAIMQALGSLPPPASYIAAGAAAVAGVAQVAAILSQSPPTSGGASGGASPSAPSAPSLGGPQRRGSAAAGVQEGASAGAASDASTPANIHVARAQDASVQVTDAYFPGTSGRLTFTKAPGDAVEVYRDGKLGNSKRTDPALLAATERQTQAMLEQNEILKGLRGDLLMQRHFQNAAPPAGRR